MIRFFSLGTLYRRYCLRNPFPLFQRHFSGNSDEHSFVVSYLIDKCGLSPKSALSAAKHVCFHTSEKADTTLSFFREVGFSKSELSRIVTLVPRLILSNNAREIFMPKIEFFESKGLSGTELTRILAVCPTILHRSLKCHIVPHFAYLKGLLGSDDDVIYTLKRYPHLFIKCPRSYIEPNTAILQRHGVPRSGILYLFSKQPKTLFASPDKFEVVVEDITRMGVDPMKLNFVIAVHVKLSMSKSTWEKKLDVYKRWGLSEKEILLAFVKYPWCMAVSEEKLTIAMDTYVNKLGMDSSAICKCPTMIGYSLKKRINPRSSVIQVLLSRGLIDKSDVTGNAFMCSENVFVKRFIVKYKEVVPYLSKLYEEQLDHGAPRPLQ